MKKSSILAPLVAIVLALSSCGMGRFYDVDPKNVTPIGSYFTQKENIVFRLNIKERCVFYKLSRHHLKICDTNEDGIGKRDTDKNLVDEYRITRPFTDYGTGWLLSHKQQTEFSKRFEQDYEKAPAGKPEPKNRIF